MRIRFALLAVAALALAGCASSTGNTDVAGPAADELDGSWLLTAATDTSGTFDLGDTAITLEIDGDRASGAAPCNSYTGAFATTADGIDLGPMASTRMACSPDSVMKLETRYLAALEAVDTATIDGDTLTLSLSDDPLELVYTETDGPETADLVGPRWNLETIVTGDETRSVELDADLVFGDDGTLHGSAGCRGFTADYVHDGDEGDSAGAQITLTRLDIDHAACPATSGEQETLVFDVIGQGFTASVVGDTLTLTRTGTDNRLVYQAGDTP